ncbi:MULTISPECIES: hypothetical protein [Rhizobium]|uniref:hypothetical protein n=1 Tax=Rhizobium TaxID=379 RepID=UPI0019CF7AFB|nr:MULTISPECIES: hypothetical protein [Rhizobium]
MADDIECPPLSDAVLFELDSDQPQFITRHMRAEQLESYRNGHFRFGTIESYNPRDKALGESRFGDFQEGRQRNHFTSPSGRFDSFIKRSSLEVEHNYAPGGIATEVSIFQGSRKTCNSGRNLPLPNWFSP